MACQVLSLSSESRSHSPTFHHPSSRPGTPPHAQAPLLTPRHAASSCTGSDPPQRVAIAAAVSAPAAATRACTPAVPLSRDTVSAHPIANSTHASPQTVGLVPSGPTEGDYTRAEKREASKLRPAAGRDDGTTVRSAVFKLPCARRFRAIDHINDQPYPRSTARQRCALCGATVLLSLNILKACSQEPANRTWCRSQFDTTWKPVSSPRWQCGHSSCTSCCCAQ